jgi:glycosyltransferase involved in cell wall biosynthesis
VITNRHPSSLPAADTVEGIGVERHAFPSLRAAPGPALRFPATFVRSVASLGRASERPDIVHVQCASVQLPPATVFARLHGVPLVLSTQGETVMDAAHVFEHSVYLRTTLRLAARSAATLTACSRWAADAAASTARRFGAAVVIPNGIDPAQWKVTPPPDEPVAAAWGRHVPQKGFDLLLAAWTVVRSELPTARLLLGGEGPETDALRAAAGEGVTLVGSLDRPGVRRLLAQSRVAVVPSRVEPFGIVALEAMAAGRGVVWSTRGGLVEATGGLGWPVDPTDPPTLARTVVEALRAHPEPERFRRRAESLSWAALADRYVEVYDTAIRSRRGLRRTSAARA